MKEKMNFCEYIDFLNSYNSQYTQNGSTYPNLTYDKIRKKEYKKLVYTNVKVKLTNIVIKMFKWKTIDTIDPRLIELGYLMRGAVCCYTGTKGTYLLPCIANNRYNIYGNPVQVRVYGWNGFNEAVDVIYKGDIPDNLVTEAPKTDFKGVYGRDNDLAYPYINYVLEYAHKLTDKIVALEIATQRIKNPFYFVIDDINLKDSVNKLVEKIEDNEDVIIRVKNKSLKSVDESIKLIQNNMHPEILTHIKDAINFDFNMFLETIGINTNPSPDKSQVVLNSEINSNNELVNLEQDIRFLNRQNFCKDVKDLIGIDISVEKNIDLQKEIENVRKELTKNGTEGSTDTTE